MHRSMMPAAIVLLVLPLVDAMFHRWIDNGGLTGREMTSGGLAEVHRRFGELLPAELSWVEEPDTGERLRVIPGEFRKRHVKVGGHLPIRPGAVPRFLRRFEEAYGSLGHSDTFVAAAGAHHRLLWIHPFLDGNGRVARLMSHAMLQGALETGGLWSISRGLARRVVDYKAHLAACDERRRGDLDGRGALSEQALADFTRFFLDVCIDQVEFMESLMQPDQFSARILAWAEAQVRHRRLHPRSTKILESLLYRGELARADVAGTVGTGERQARRIVAELLATGSVVSGSPRAPLRLAFPAALASHWMPGLFPG